MLKHLERLAVWMALAAGVILLSITLVTVTNVGAFALDRVARLFGANIQGLTGYEDFVRLIIGAGLMMMFPYCQAKRSHVAVDLFIKFLPPWLQKAMDVVSQLLMAAIVLFLAYWLTIGMMEARDDRLVSRVLGWPEWPFYIPGIFALTLWALIAAVQIFEKAPDHG